MGNSCGNARNYGGTGGNVIEIEKKMEVYKIQSLLFAELNQKQNKSKLKLP